jgi:hypothetical protein
VLEDGIAGFGIGTRSRWRSRSIQPRWASPRRCAGRRSGR